MKISRCKELSFFFICVLLGQLYLPYTAITRSLLIQNQHPCNAEKWYCHRQETNYISFSLATCMFWNYKNPSPSLSLYLPFSLIETLLISCSSAHCWPVRRVIHLGDDDNSRWHTVIPEGLQTVWFSVGVKRKSASRLVIKQADLHSSVSTVREKAMWANGFGWHSWWCCTISTLIYYFFKTFFAIIIQEHTQKPLYSAAGAYIKQCEVSKMFLNHTTYYTLIHAIPC